MVVEESCHRFRANEVRLRLNVLAYNLGNLWRRLVLPTRMDSWSLRQLVAHQCAAAPRQDRRTLGESRPVLLAPVGREPPDAPAVWVHARADLRATGANRLTGGGCRGLRLNEERKEGGRRVRKNVGGVVPRAAIRAAGRVF
jgi:hypothetical protein